MKANPKKKKNEWNGTLEWIHTTFANMLKNKDFSFFNLMQAFLAKPVRWGKKIH